MDASTPPSPPPAPALPSSRGEPRFWPAVQAALAEPGGLFRDMNGLSGVASPLVFATTLGIVMGAITALFGLGLGALLLARGGGGSGSFGLLAVPLVVLRGLFITPFKWFATAVIGGLLVHVIARISGGRGTFARSLRIAAYSLAPVALVSVAQSVLMLFPFAGLVVRAAPLAMVAWWAWVVSHGVETLHGGRRSVALGAAVVVALGGALLLARLPGLAAAGRLPLH